MYTTGESEHNEYGLNAKFVNRFTEIDKKCEVIFCYTVYTHYEYGTITLVLLRVKIYIKH